VARVAIIAALTELADAARGAVLSAAIHVRLRAVLNGIVAAAAAPAATGIRQGSVDVAARITRDSDIVRYGAAHEQGADRERWR
jgi:hypothetical protein